LETGAIVERLVVEGGAVRAVRCADGREFAGSQVLASCNPRTVLLDLLPPAVLPLAIRDQIGNFRCRGTAAKLHLALDGPLTLGGREVEIAHLGGGTIDAFERAFDAVKYRQASQHPFLEVRQPTVPDASLAPAGGHVLSVLVAYAPYELEGGWTREAKEALAARVIERLDRSCPGLRQRVVGVQTLTPADLEVRYNLPGGHLHHGEHALDQLLFVRPSHRLAHYATPVDGLFLAGGGSHPGGGLSGVPGWLAAGAALGR
jgi:phytoene dehydrogenase-like protein